MFVIPIVLSLPTMFFPIPPLMVLIPTSLPFGVQVSPPILRLAAVLAVIADRFVQIGLGLLDGVPTLVPFICLDARRCRE